MPHVFWDWNMSAKHDYSSCRLAAGLAHYQVAVLILEICNCTCTYAVYIASVFEYINCTVTRILSL